MTNYQTRRHQKERSIFSPFDDGKFITDYRSWRILEGYLEGDGGAYGIAGPRGAGKTWLIQKGVRYAVDERGVGLWFPAPSYYKGVEFLSALADNFANEVIEHFPVKPWYPRASSPWIMLASLLLLIILSINGLRPTFHYDAFSELADMDYEIASGNATGLAVVRVLGNFLSPFIWYGLFIATIAYAVGFYIQNFWRNGFLNLKAIELKQRIRYTESLSRNISSSAKVSGNQADIGVSVEAQRSLAERAWTIATLVYDFRYFLELVVNRTGRKVVIGIDELDKIHDIEQAKELLRDIKGIFDVNGVHFLVSVSDEAKKTLNLGALQERDEFNSSFYTVIEILPNSPEDCIKLIDQRTKNEFDQDAKLAIAILSGGNLREVLRLTDICQNVNEKENEKITLRGALAAIINAEALAIRNEVISSNNLPESIKVKVYQFLNTDNFSNAEFLANLNLEEFPEPDEITENSNDDFPMQPDKNFLMLLANLRNLWSKFFIRFIAIQIMLRSSHILSDKRIVQDLQKAVVTIGTSAKVAEHTLGELVQRNGLSLASNTNPDNTNE